MVGSKELLDMATVSMTVATTPGKPTFSTGGMVRPLGQRVRAPASPTMSSPKVFLNADKSVSSMKPSPFTSKLGFQLSSGGPSGELLLEPKASLNADRSLASTSPSRLLSPKQVYMTSAS